VVGSTSRYREACARFSLVIVLSVEKPAVTFGLLPKFSRTRSIFAIQEHCAGIDRPILPSEVFVIAAARVCFGAESGEKNSCQLVPGVLMCRPGWLPRPTFLLATLLIITKYYRAKHNGCGRPKIWM
ncbi:uncharacterized protein METZ01_LOCUS9505, partial [marine metagenome]